MNILEIPLVGGPQDMSIPLNGVTYRMTVLWRDAPTMDGGWCVDIADSGGNPIVQGIPLVTGANLLEQYEYLNINGELWVQTDNDIDAVPTFDNLGQASHLYFVMR